ncbi:hypothetical protein CASFOL_000203 [Castilleja foliolosa]|uniref:Uncharacterized protein n=1 Tax=Castilleja foliolosa TaxID=1961234 RepID=A0ABD3EQ39_9LAMI
MATFRRSSDEFFRRKLFPVRFSTRSFLVQRFRGIEGFKSASDRRRGRPIDRRHRTPSDSSARRRQLPGSDGDSPSASATASRRRQQPAPAPTAHSGDLRQPGSTDPPPDFDWFYFDGYLLQFGDFPAAIYDLDGLVIEFGIHGFDELDDPSPSNSPTSKVPSLGNE